MAKKTCSCSGPNSKTTCSCCPLAENSAPDARQLLIELLYIDITSCERCIGTQEALDAAVSQAAALLQMSGFEIVVKRTLVSSEEEARNLRFVSSPTIRINGRDIQLQIEENRCATCGEICGDEVDCRVWVWRGERYATPPRELIVDAMLREIYAENQFEPTPYQDVPQNLKTFFAAKIAKGKSANHVKEVNK